jgi:hypothetical protein
MAISRELESIPGTEILLSADDANSEYSKSGNLVLVPEPSNDPHDPLVSSHPLQTITF